MALTHIIDEYNTTIFPVDDLEGLDLPAFYCGAEWTRVIPESCKACSKSCSAHKVWSKCALTPATRNKAIQQEFITALNNIKENIRKTQRIIQLNHLTTCGITETTLLIGQNPVYSHVGSYPIISASGKEVTLQYVNGTPDPWAIMWYELTRDPETNLLVSTQKKCSLPSCATMKVSSNSQLKDYESWIIQRYFGIHKDMEYGDTFTLYLETEIGGLVLERVPGSIGEITAEIQCYLQFPETWIQPIDYHALWVVPKTKIINTPTQSIYTIEASARIKAHEAGTDWIRAYSYSGGIKSDIEIGHLVGIQHKHVGIKPHWI
jgi:hypothetical protein